MRRCVMVNNIHYAAFKKSIHINRFWTLMSIVLVKYISLAILLIIALAMAFKIFNILAPFQSAIMLLSSSSPQAVATVAKYSSQITSFKTWFALFLGTILIVGVLWFTLSKYVLRLILQKKSFSLAQFGLFYASVFVLTLLNILATLLAFTIDDLIILTVVFLCIQFLFVLCSLILLFSVTNTVRTSLRSLITNLKKPLAIIFPVGIIIVVCVIALVLDLLLFGYLPILCLLVGIFLLFAFELWLYSYIHSYYVLYR